MGSSDSSETVFVRGVRTSRLIASIEAFLGANGLVRVPHADVARVERRDGNIQRLALRRDAKWLVLADPIPHGLSAWGEHLSRHLGRSVLTIATWEDEAMVTAERWKDGKVRARLELLREAIRGADGRPRAPAKVLWPWLDPAQRPATLRDGIPLREGAGESTGDAELDELLEDFDDVDEANEASEDGHVYVPTGVSVASLGRAIGLRRPFLDPWNLDESDQELVFRARA